MARCLAKDISLFTFDNGPDVDRWQLGISRQLATDAREPCRGGQERGSHGEYKVMSLM